MKQLTPVITLICLFFILPMTHSTAQPGVDNAIWADLLEKHVVNARVNYSGFKKDEKQLDTYLAVLSRTDIKALSKTGQFAFYINAYNAFTIKLILTKYPGINSIKEIGSFFSNPWQKKFIPLGKRVITLDDIEHKILRPWFKDPRVHFAINCASKSCPPLRSEPYEATLLETQLDDQSRMFINDTKNNYVKDNTLYVSNIFKWFKDDFSDKPRRFILEYAEASLKTAIQEAGHDIKMEYLPYDWSLNR